MKVDRLEKSSPTQQTTRRASKGTLKSSQSPTDIVSIAEEVVASKDPVHDIFDQLSAENREIVDGLIRQLARKEGIRVSTALNTLPYPAQALDLWQSNLELRGMSIETIRSYRHKVERLLAQYPKPTNLDINTFLSKLLHEGVVEGDVMKLRARKGTINNYIKAIRSFFNYVYDNRFWNFNPSKGIKLVKQDITEKYCPPEADVRQLLDEIKNDAHSLKEKTMLVLFLETGVRVTELATIRCTSVHFDRLEIVVQGKGHKERSVPVSRYTAGLLFEYMKTLNESETYLFPATRSDTLSGHYGKRAIEKWLDKLCKHIGIAHVTPHQLRHFVATRYLERGADIKAVSQLLGHADVTITLKTYHHVGRRQVRQMQDQLGVFSNEALQLVEGKKNDD